MHYLEDCQSMSDTQHWQITREFNNDGNTKQECFIMWNSCTQQMTGKAKHPLGGSCLLCSYVATYAYMYWNILKTTVTFV